MNYTLLGNGNTIAYIESDEILIFDIQSALDLMVNVRYEKDCNRFIVDKKNVSEEFFKLSSGLAGDVLQKYINYQTKLAIVGDYTRYTSKPLHDFIYECNKGNDFYFVDSLDQAIEKLTLAK
jgi:hypothetical protein